jgi:hypothetical protein
VKITWLGFSKTIALFIKTAYLTAILLLAYAFVTDSIAFHQVSFQLQNAQARALMLIADELHGTRL